MPGSGMQMRSLGAVAATEITGLEGDIVQMLSGKDRGKRIGDGHQGHGHSS